MDQKAARAAIGKVLKQRGVKARKGQLRLAAGDLWWYVSVRSDSPAPGAPLRFELGCWVPEAAPEPEGGAVDCPLLLDVPVAEDPAASAGALVDLVEQIGSLPALAGFVAGRPEALVDRALRDMLASL